eukprot:4515962-Amphidinium_carterae.1
MEPTLDEISGWKHVSDVLAWAGVPGDPTDGQSDAGRFLSEIGATAAQHWRPLAMIPAESMDALVLAIA